MCGLNIRYEEAGGTDFDDTTLNGLQMTCCDYQTGDAVTVYPGDGHYGDWNYWYVCSSQYYIPCGMLTRFEWGEHDDDTALNGIDVKCCHNRNWGDQEARELQQGDYGSWDMSWTMCNEGFYICGINFRLEGVLGAGIDDTAGNGIEMRCCQRDY